MAKGLDCGTSFYIAATKDTIKKQRNAFLTVSTFSNFSTSFVVKNVVPK